MNHKYKLSAINFSPGIGHIYSFLVGISILVVIFASWLKMYKRNIPTKPLESGAIVIVIFGIIGARIWYVLNYLNQQKYWYSFIDWRNGGLAIQGAVFFGLVAGFVIFYKASRYYRISMWVYLDCIVPNILLGQAIGRWGNFFNQEVLGHDNGAPFSFLPAFINNYLHYPEDNKPGIYRQPLFLYESIATFISWIILTFVVNKVGFWISKKPWLVEAQKYQIVSPNNKLNAKNCCKWKQMWNRQQQKKAIWRQAYYDYEPVTVKRPIRKKTKILKITPNLTWKERWKRKLLNRFHYYCDPFFYDATPLNNSYNPYQYKVTAAGVSGSLYFVFYGIIRIILEPFRYSRDLMQINGVSTSVVVSCLWVIIGITLLIFAQYIAKNKFRQKGWFYERQY